MKTKLLSPALFALFLFSTAFLSPAFAQPSDLDGVIALNGTGVVKMEVDMAIVNGAIVTKAKTVTEAQAENAKTFNALVTSLKEKFALTNKELRSTGYSIAPIYTYPT